MAIHKCDDGTYVIAAGHIWLPGCYEDERAARYAFRLSDLGKARLRDRAVARGNPVITWGDVAKAAEQERKERTHA